MPKTDECLEFIASLLTTDTTKWPTAEEALAHSWLPNYSDDANKYIGEINAFLSLKNTQDLKVHYLKYLINNPTEKVEEKVDNTQVKKPVKTYAKYTKKDG